MAWNPLTGGLRNAPLGRAQSNPNVSKQAEQSVLHLARATGIYDDIL